MQLDAVELCNIGTLILLAGAGCTVAVAKGQVTARLIRIHGIEHLLLVPHKAVQLVLHVLLLSLIHISWPRLILPFLVSLKRFLAPECVFSFILAILVSS